MLTWRWSVVSSLVLHAVVIGGSLYLSFAPPSPDLRPLSKLPPYAGQVLADNRRIAAAMTPAQKRQAIEQQLPALSRIKTSDVKEIARLVEAAETATTGSPARATEPRPGVGGEFDSDSASLFDIKRKPMTKAGAPVLFEWVLIDKAGRTLKYDQRESEMTDDDRNLARICEMARQNPNLGVLFDSARRIAGAVRDRAAKSGR